MRVKMIKTSLKIIICVSLAVCDPLPQFFSLNIGFGSDSSPLTFNNPESAQPSAPSLQPQQSSFPQQSLPVTPASPPARSAPAPPVSRDQFSQHRSNSLSQSTSGLSVFGAPTEPSLPTVQQVQNRPPQQPPPHRVPQQPQPHQDRQQAPPRQQFQQSPPRQQFQQPLPRQQFQQPPPRQQFQQPPPRQQFQQPPPRQGPQQLPSSQFNNVESHQEALERNALHRKQLAEVIEVHNDKTFSKLDDPASQISEVPNEVKNKKEVMTTKIRKTKIPRKKSIEIEKTPFLGKSTSPIRTQKFTKEDLPENIRDDIIEHLELINSLDQQIQEVAAKAALVFPTIRESDRTEQK